MKNKNDNAGIACVNQIPLCLQSATSDAGFPNGTSHLIPAAATVRSTHGMK